MEAAVAFRFALATVFILAGLAKLGRRSEFARAIRRYELLPPMLVQPVAAIIPPLELAAGALLAVGLGIVVVAIALAALLATFSAAVAINLLRGRRFDCGCFSPGVPIRLTWLTVLRNAVLIGFAIVVAIEAPQPLSLDAWIRGGASAGASNQDALALLIVGTLGVLGAAILQEARNLTESTSSLRAELAEEPR